ncbi:hypothetical protein LOTGIDRAFT_106386, partial [Lottia gigantea]
RIPRQLNNDNSTGFPGNPTMIIYRIPRKLNNDNSTGFPGNPTTIIVQDSQVTQL